MTETIATPQAATTNPPAMGLFERYLTLWVGLCIVAGVVLGQAAPALFHVIGAATVFEVNLPVAALVWLMIIPMLLKIDLAALGQVREHWRGVAVTVGVNWLVNRSPWRCSAGCSSRICSGRCCPLIKSTPISPG
jgi:ACR3 family arsenite transporter